MRVGVDALELDADTDAELWGYLQMAAHSLVNTDDARRGQPRALTTPSRSLLTSGKTVEISDPSHRFSRISARICR